MTAKPFWQTKELSALSAAEWESLCARCGRCCQIKLEDEDSGEVYFTDVVCRYFDLNNCSCTCYAERCRLIPACLKLTPDNLTAVSWMPKLCAYRILSETGRLPNWHPLVTKRPLSDEHSVRGRVVSEKLIRDEDLEDHIIEEEDNDLFC